MKRKLSIDHVTIAGPILASLEQAFAEAGLATEYGGPHSNGITHMALLGFPDGSYIELISVMEPGQSEAVFWGKHIDGNGGPCAWAIRVDDIAAEAARVAALGVTVKGPAYYNRRRPDGILVEWELAFLGDKGAGAVLPFLIQDITPRELRVRPSASVMPKTGPNNDDGQLRGVARVILGVENLDMTIELFQHVYSWPEPDLKEDAAFGARLAYFVDTPVILAAPLAGHDWLSKRLAHFGESPCAYLLETNNLEAVCRRFQLEQPARWFESQVAWFEPTRLAGIKLGVAG